MYYNVSEKILDAMKKKGLSKKDVSRALDIPYSTLNDKLKNNTFSAQELLVFAVELNIDLNKCLMEVYEILTEKKNKISWSI